MMKKGMILLAHSLIIQLDPLLVLCQDFLQPHGHQSRLMQPQVSGSWVVHKAFDCFI